MSDVCSCIMHETVISPDVFGESEINVTIPKSMKSVY